MDKIVDITLRTCKFLYAVLLHDSNALNDVIIVDDGNVMGCKSLILSILHKFISDNWFGPIFTTLAKNRKNLEIKILSDIILYNRIITGQNAISVAAQYSSLYAHTVENSNATQFMNALIEEKIGDSRLLENATSPQDSIIILLESAQLQQRRIVQNIIEYMGFENCAVEFAAVSNLLETYAML